MASMLVLRNIGEFGLFQQINLFALCFPSIIQSFAVASLLFVEFDPERHCNTDWILSAGPNLTTEEQLNLTLPREEDGSFSRCQMFVPVDWDIDAIRENGLNETTRCLNGWVYGNMLYEATIVTDVSSIYTSSLWLSSVFFFFCRFGRKRAIQIPTVMLLVFTVTTAQCPNVYLYLVSQFLVGVGAGGYRSYTLVITATEWIGASKRSWGVGVAQLFGAIGQCVLAGLIYGVRKWRLTTGSVIFSFRFIPESARWLLNRGRTEEAKKLIIKAAAINKRPIPDSLLEEVLNHCSILGTSLQIHCWFSLNLSIYSLYFDMASLGLSIFVTQLLFGVFEVPALLLSMKISISILFSTSKFLFFCSPSGYAIASTCLAELFPTSVSDAEGNRYASSKQVNLGQLLTPLSKP
uniref:Solute carrier family 22 member 13a n=1 Tax=Amphiprion percula TaxID=161767 RepID=A0A3P8TXT6_AMPPE